MNILTKIAIVVLVLAVAFAAPVFTTLAVIVPDYKSKLDNQEKLAQAMEQQANRLKDDISTLKHAADVERAKNTRLEAELASERTHRTQVLNRLADDQVAIVEQIRGINQGQDRFVQIAKFFDDRTSAYRQTIDTLRGDIKTMYEARAKMEDANRQLQSQLAQLQSELQSAREQLVDRDQQIEDLQQRLNELQQFAAQPGGGGPATARGPAPAAPGTEGIVTLGTAGAAPAELMGRVDTVSDDLASINIGKAQGVTQNMKLMISRGSQFVAYLVVQRVAQGEASGIVIQKQMEPQSGDQVRLAPKFD